VVQGQSSAWILKGKERREFQAGEMLRTPLAGANAGGR
jgi:hypothetical protein